MQSNPMQRKQRGATIWVNLIWLMMGIVIAIVGVKLIPIYLDNYTVIGALEGLEAEQDLKKFKDKDIHRTLEKFFTINNVRHVDKDQIVIERSKKTKELKAVHIDYEVRQPLFYNVDVVVSFANEMLVRDAK